MKAYAINTWTLFFLLNLRLSISLEAQSGLKATVPAFFYALIKEIFDLVAAYFQVCWVGFGLFIGVFFTFLLIYRFGK